ncbi:MAG: MFS transporter, partial [Deltaproteobacteria bacterium]|nr:MFS transporter [Deltaproteobacteria bacterium]
INFPGVVLFNISKASNYWRPLEALLRLRALEALRHRDFRLLWYGHVFSSMATWMDSIARGWLIYELTNSSFQLGLVRGVQAVPMLLLSPIAGSAADLYSRKTQILIAQIIDGLLYAWVAVMIITGNIQPWHVYLTSLGLATVQSFQHPSRAAMVSDTVPLECLTNAFGLNAVVFNLARSAGPALAGLLITAFGTGGSYSVQAVFYLLATIWTIMLRPERRPSAAPDGRAHRGESFGQNIIEGWKFSWRSDEVRISLLVVSIAMLLLIPFTTLLPVFARDIFQVGAKGQGLLLTSMGVGALFSSVLVAFLGDRMPRGIVMIGGVALYGVLVVILSASSWFSLSIIVMFIIGLCHVTSHALIQTVIQSYSPPEFRGRTMAIFHMTQVILVIGAMLVGGLASLVGARWAAASMSLTGTILMVAIFVLMPKASKIH